MQCIGNCVREMASLAVEEKRQLEMGAKEVNSFGGAVRSLENTGLEKGDKFTFPTKYDKIYQRMFGENKASFILVEISPDNVKPFYPTTFTKSRTIYNEDKTSTGKRVHTTGTAAEIFQKCATIDEGMQKLAGKTVIVSDVKTIRTLRYNSTELMNAQIPVIDLVE